MADEIVAITVTDYQQAALARLMSARPDFGETDYFIEDQVLRAVWDALPAVADTNREMP